jgi:CheY-like chemotaxis protein
MSEKLILLVEDDPVQAEAWELRLRQAGYRVMVAGSAEQALEAIGNRYFHVAVIDQSLKSEPPGEDSLGLDVVAYYLKQQIDKQALPPVPYIILTAYPDYEPLKRAYGDLDVFAYISKGDSNGCSCSCLPTGLK